jgi:D-glycero-alpha-D-manno-heptose-7-phosphate kinase
MTETVGDMDLNSFEGIVYVNAVAPTRICDVGGWTDTHFARSGAVFNVAIYPYVEVQLSLQRTEDTDQRVVIHAENFGESYSLDPKHIVYSKHPLLEAALHVMNLPDELNLAINLYSAAPPGASMGTSAAVSVALIGALDALTSGRLSPKEVATLAHSIETKELGLECGIQDQIASAHGGINFIEMRDFPESTVTPVRPADPIWWELENRLSVFYIGQPHSSSDIHKKVIAGMGTDPSRDDRLEQLRHLAQEAKEALLEGDFEDLGRIFDANTEVQRKLHPQLVCERFEEIISIAKDFDALGCKVNGAGGDGGSIAILSNQGMARKREMEKALIDKGFQALPLYLSRRGIRVWKSSGNRVRESS